MSISVMSLCPYTFSHKRVSIKWDHCFMQIQIVIIKAGCTKSLVISVNSHRTDKPYLVTMTLCMRNQCELTQKTKLMELRKFIILAWHAKITAVQNECMYLREFPLHTVEYSLVKLSRWGQFANITPFRPIFSMCCSIEFVHIEFYFRHNPVNVLLKYK